jgi:hypothetical protein
MKAAIATTGAVIQGACGAGAAAASAVTARLR